MEWVLLEKGWGIEVLGGRGGRISLERGGRSSRVIPEDPPVFSV